MRRPPNVLLLLLDTARAQNFACYGYQRSTSPHIDAIAQEGVLYEQAIAPSCWSLPSQVSLLTGMLPSKHGAHERHLSYAHAYPMLPEVLRDAGYCTLGISPNSWMSDEFGVTHGFDVYLKLWQYRPTMPATALKAATPTAALARQLNRLYSKQIFPWRSRARHVTQYLCRLLKATPEPFFCYVIYWDMHLPYWARKEYTARWLPAQVPYRRARHVNRSHLRYFAGQAPMTAEDFAVLRAFYDGALATIDAEVGELMALLRERGLLERTLLIITSDHGENIGEHGLMSHAYSLHDTLIRVPLIIRYPARFPPGQRVSYQVQLTDLFPTVLDVLQLEVPAVRQELQGMSLLHADPEACEGRPAYAEMLAPHPSIQTLNRYAGVPENTPRPAYDRALRCLRLPEVKIIWASDGQHALYDLRRDPDEITNRFAEDPELAGELLDALEHWHPGSEVSSRQGTPDVDPAMRQRLRDLGYIE